MISELDTVVLLHDIEEHGLTGGDIGAVVHSYDDDDDGSVFEVEFVTAGGSTIALLTLKEDEIRPMLAKEILHARELVAA